MIDTKQTNNRYNSTINELYTHKATHTKYARTDYINKHILITYRTNI